MLVTEKIQRRKCTIFPFHPWGPKEEKRSGIVLWVPQTLEELIKKAAEQLQLPEDCYMLTEDAGKILDVDMIDDGEKLYLISETHKI